MTDPITDADLDEWERIEKAATPGPWGIDSRRQLSQLLELGAGVPLMQERAFLDRHDGSLAVLARNAFPLLLAENRKLRAHIIDTVGEEGLRELLGRD